jgi:uncharacterized protein (DUF2132 family)
VGSSVLAEAHHQHTLAEPPGTIHEQNPIDSAGMTDSQPNNPLHGIKLQDIVAKLIDHYGWDGLADKISINCFKNDPSLNSTLKFLRKTPWARTQVENLYLSTFS